MSPHLSRYPSSPPASNDYDSYQTDKKKSGTNSNINRRKPTSTMGRERIAEEGIPVLIVVIIGIVLLMLNMCACGAVIYQKRRVRQREDNLRRQIKRLRQKDCYFP